LNTELPAGHPGTLVSSSVWQEVNYILNHQTYDGTNAFYWDVQAAINTLVGSAVGQPSYCGTPPNYTTPTPDGVCGYPTYDPVVVNALLAAAAANAATWVAVCGDVYGVIYVTQPCSDQFIMLEVPIVCPQTVCCPVPSQNCYGGSLWCNAHLTCNPGKNCTVYCQNSSVTLTCTDGKTYCYPVPNCQVNFSANCEKPSCSFQGGNWCTTAPCSGDSQIFLSGCGIPWQSDFEHCISMCWTGTFTCSTPGVNCQWQCGSSCYNANLCNCSTIQVNPCYQNSCGYPSGDCAGTPENYKQFCQGNNNYGDNNYGNQCNNNYGNQGNNYGNQCNNNYGNQGNNYGNQGSNCGNQGNSYGNQGNSYGNQGNNYGNQGNNYGNQGNNSYCGSWSQSSSFGWR
jgi:hypothetical protein